MIYMGHNFASNYMNANGSGDQKMKRDILLSEIAKIIVSNPSLVNKHLVACGFKPAGTNIDNLSNAVSAALKKSQRFAKKMAYEIIGGNYGAAGTLDTASATTGTGSGSGSGGGGEMSVGNGTTVPMTTYNPTTNSTQSTSGGGGTTGVQTTESTTFGSGTVSGPVVQPPANQPAGATSVSTVGVPVVIDLGRIFGGIPPTNVGKTTTDTSVGGGGGLGSGSFGGGSAVEELKDKANAMANKSGSTIKKLLGFGLFLGAVAGIYYYYNKNK